MYTKNNDYFNIKPLFFFLLYSFIDLYGLSARRKTIFDTNKDHRQKNMKNKMFPFAIYFLKEKFHFVFAQNLPKIYSYHFYLKSKKNKSLENLTNYTIFFTLNRIILSGIHFKILFIHI